MIKKGKVPVAVVSFNLKNPEEGPFARLRSPFHNLDVGDLVVVNTRDIIQLNGSNIALAHVQEVDWSEPHPNKVSSAACVLSYLDPASLLKESMLLQASVHTDAVQYKKNTKQRKEEIENTVRELQKEILKLVKELDTL